LAIAPIFKETAFILFGLPIIWGIIFGFYWVCIKTGEKIRVAPWIVILVAFIILSLIGRNLK
jgi:hypothetical protein